MSKKYMFLSVVFLFFCLALQGQAADGCYINCTVNGIKSVVMAKDINNILEGSKDGLALLYSDAKNCKCEDETYDEVIAQLDACNSSGGVMEDTFGEPTQAAADGVDVFGSNYSEGDNVIEFPDGNGGVLTVCMPDKDEGEVLSGVAEMTGSAPVDGISELTFNLTKPDGSAIETCECGYLTANLIDAGVSDYSVLSGNLCDPLNTFEVVSGVDITPYLGTQTILSGAVDILKRDWHNLEWSVNGGGDEQIIEWEFSFGGTDCSDPPSVPSCPAESEIDTAKIGKMYSFLVDNDQRIDALLTGDLSTGTFSIPATIGSIEESSNWNGFSNLPVACSLADGTLNNIRPRDLSSDTYLCEIVTTLDEYTEDVDADLAGLTLTAVAIGEMLKSSANVDHLSFYTAATVLSDGTPLGADCVGDNDAERSQTVVVIELYTCEVSPELLETFTICQSSESSLDGINIGELRYRVSPGPGY